MNFTLVAYYGVKPELIENLIKDAINKLRNLLGDKFLPYTLEQVHGTIIGLEGCRVDDRIINTNYLEKRKEFRAQNFSAMFQLLKKSSILPFNVTIGGFRDDGRYSFTSRDVVPYLRSFSIQGSYVVAMGWPYENGRYSKSMDELRRAFNSANILHKYHDLPESEDNDFFFVLGNLNKESINNTQLQEAQGCLRSFLAEYEPVEVPITRECLRLVGYVDTKLPQKTSCSYTMDEAEENIDKILAMYSEILA